MANELPASLCNLTRPGMDVPEKAVHPRGACLMILSHAFWA